jgi:hypothetical protein
VRSRHHHADQRAVHEQQHGLLRRRLRRDQPGAGPRRRGRTMDVVAPGAGPGGVTPTG